MKTFYAQICFCCFLALVVLTGMADNTPIKPEGKGTKDSPYLISCIENLVWLGNKVEKVTNCYFRMTADIDASETKYWNGGRGFEPIGKVLKSSEKYGYETRPSLRAESSFQGHFDGAGHVISNLHVNQTNEVQGALFGAVGYYGDLEAATSHQYMYDYSNDVAFVRQKLLDAAKSHPYRSSISNLHLKNVHIMNSLNVAALAGIAINSDITDCRVDGALHAEEYLCGLAVSASLCDIRRCGICIDFDNRESNFSGLAYQIYHSYVSDIECKGNFKSSKSGGFLRSYCISWHVLQSEIKNCIVTLKYKGNDGKSTPFFCFNPTNNYYGCIASGCYRCREFSGDTDRWGAKNMTALKKKDTYKDWDFDNVWEIEDGNSFPTLRQPKPAAESARKGVTGSLQKKPVKSPGSKFVPPPKRKAPPLKARKTAEKTE